MKKVLFMLFIVGSIFTYSNTKCETEVRKLIESAVKIEENYSYLEPEYKGNNIYETKIFDENINISDVLIVKASTGTVYSIYDFYDKNNNSEVKLYQNEKYKCIRSK